MDLEIIEKNKIIAEIEGKIVQKDSLITQNKNQI